MDEPVSLTFKVDQSESLLPVEPGSNSLRLPIGPSGNIRHALVPHPPQHLAKFWSKPVGSKAEIFFLL